MAAEGKLEDYYLYDTYDASPATLPSSKVEPANPQKGEVTEELEQPAVEDVKVVPEGETGERTIDDNILRQIVSLDSTDKVTAPLVEETVTKVKVETEKAVNEDEGEEERDEKEGEDEPKMKPLRSLR